MSDNLNPGIGTILAISKNLPASPFGATEYGAVTGFDVIGEITEIPEAGLSHDVVTHVPLATGITAKYHGAANAGSVTIPFAYDATDDGQETAEEVLGTRQRCTFKTTLADGTEIYRQGKVMGFQIGASAGAVVSGNISIEFETVPVMVPAGS